MNKIDLHVPLYTQKIDSVECGLVNMQMIYEYYRIPITLEKLREDLKTTEIGTYAPQLGMHLLEQNFYVEIITHNPKLITLNKQLNSREKIEHHLDELMTDKTTSANDKIVFGMFLNFIKAGGSINAAIPSIEHIRHEITQGRPLIAFLQSGAWYTTGSERPYSDIFHIVTVTGLDDEFVYFNDPRWVHGGRSKRTYEEFLYALYSSTLADPDNGCLIKVNKK